MNSKDQHLLCTFTINSEYKNLVPKIIEFYNIPDQKIFIFTNTKNVDEKFLTYSVSNTNKKFTNTISIHRKKDSNTLYTLNAMNKLIIEENNGVFDKQFQINWNLYKNCLVLTHEVGVKIIELSLLDIIYL